MAQAQTTGHQLVLGHADAEASGGFHWLSPVLIGLSLPFVATLATAPFLLANAWMPVMTLLTAISFLAIGIYTVSVLMPGEISGLVIDQKARTLTVVQDGVFASRRTDFEFNEIADLRLATYYDRDGYAEHVAELRPRDQAPLALPPSVTRAQITAGRLALGLRIDG